LQFRKVSIPGLNIEVEVNRIGMSGTLAYEIRGLKEDGPNVYHAAYEIGKPMGLKRLGWRSYPVNHAFVGYPQVTVSYAKEREEVIVKWGDYVKRIKDIRTVIAKFPLNDLVENKKYDISPCPYGFEE
jgi:glycine cleavage T protein